MGDLRALARARMSVLETAVLPVGRRGSAEAQRRLRSLRLTPLAVLAGLALAYLVLLVVRFPQIVAWQNADSDVASFYTLAGALVHGHAGRVQLSTQGTWLELAWMELTAGLAAHRLLWELGAPLLGVVTVAVVVRLVAQVSGRRAALLCASLLTAASPMVLMCAISVTWHNTTPLAAALLGAHLVWLSRRPRSIAVTLASVGAVGLLSGLLVACDQLAGIVAVGPYLIAAAAICRGTGSRRELVAAVETTLVAIVAWGATGLIVHALNLRDTVPGFGLSFTGAGHRAVWLVQGVLRLGNGRWLATHSPLLTPLIVACAVVTVLALLAMVRLTVRLYPARMMDRNARAAAVHCVFWAASVTCCAASYLFSNRVIEASDQYLVIIMYAVAATVPMLIANGRGVRRAAGRRGRALVSVGAALFIAGSLVALATGEMAHRPVMYRSSAVPQLAGVERLVSERRLGIGYAGYWDAAALTWSSDGRLQIAPLIDIGRPEPMYFLRAAAWYRPRAHTPSYVILAPGDSDFPDALPDSLPRPDRVFHLGDVTIDAWRYDVAAYFARSLIPVPGTSAAELRAARRVDRSRS